MSRCAKPANGPLLDWSPEIRRRYAVAIERLHRDLGKLPDSKMADLEHWLITECEEARALNGQDWQAAMRRADREARTRSKALSKAAKEIASYMRDFPHAGGFICAGTWLALREKGLTCSLRAAEGEIGLAEAMARLCDQLADSALVHNPAGRGPWIWRSSIPGAIYAAAIDDRRKNRRGPPDLATVLAFHLVMWLRWATAQTPFVVSAGVPMPRAGRPHYGVADAFLSCALNGQNFSAEARLKDNPNLQYLSWTVPTIRARTRGLSAH